jgi:glycosyltransferase involved in cell wall biosynthesis
VHFRSAQQGCTQNRPLGRRRRRTAETSGTAQGRALEMAQSGDEFKFALLLPVTSRRASRATLFKNLSTLAASVRPGVDSAGKYKWKMYVGVDKDDRDCGGVVLQLNKELGQCVRVVEMKYPGESGQPARVWRFLARKAFEDGNDFAVLLGDDVVVHSKNWASEIVDMFKRIANERELPFGFACVAFHDTTFPSFPTFPVLHRVWFELSESEVFPDAFTTSDADPFVFQTLRAFDAARIAPGAMLSNTIGGAGEPRYDKQPVPDFTKLKLLRDYRTRAQEWLATQIGVENAAKRRILLLDVCVPTFRGGKDLLQRILDLPVPPDCSTQFTIVSDNPANKRVADEMEKANTKNPFVRIRSNACNLGAAQTRNRALSESFADWVVFLDDDVMPQTDLLAMYKKAIAEHPNATGFVGLTQLPLPVTARQAGIHAAGVVFFWGAAKTYEFQTELPWGITANICLRRAPLEKVAFGPDFPHTGGGEDIDYCLRLREWHAESCKCEKSLIVERCTCTKGLVAAPDAVVLHPYWDDGVPRLSHFMGWAHGDGKLWELHPRFVYRTFPNLFETLLAVLFLGAAAALASLGPGDTPGPVWVIGTTAVVAAATVSADVADALHDVVCCGALRELPPGLRLRGACAGVVVRLVSEAARLRGHLQRGGVRHLCSGWNWFGEMWPGFVGKDRRDAARRFALRVLFVTVVAALLPPPAHGRL